VDAYCLKCRDHREMLNPEAGFNVNGSPVTRGTCAVCGTRMNKTGYTEAHKGLTAPEVKKKEIVKKGKLVIVESPAKAKTVGRFLGKGFTVRASVGHVRDLLRSELSVDVDHDFTPKYRVPNEKRAVVKELKELVKHSSEIYLATDPDREGEAIAWHLMEAADIPESTSKRVVFHEITENAIHEAFSNPRSVNLDLVNAQQARRIMDRLVGYSLSPLLWEKVRSRLSAGRVQSVALRLVVEREREIDGFISQEFWTVMGEFRQEDGKQSYVAKLVRIDNEDKNGDLKSKAAVDPLLDDLQKAAFILSKIKRSERRRKPSAPFITSTLQQEASRKLGFTARRTMALAQQLYEGIDVGEGGSTGLITYMRTDSTNIAAQAQAEARSYIKQRHGGDFLPPSAPQYKTKVVGAQEAHEAIRPTSVFREPEKVKEVLARDQFRLYQLIWQRFVASQMESAVYDILSIEINGQGKDHQYTFRTVGSTVKFPGYRVVYEEAADEDAQKDEEENNRIPAHLKEGARQLLQKINPEQHFTQPPPRYTEATLVQKMEENGIGRPSTYAPILSTIQERGYVLREQKRLSPTDTGILVNDLLMQHFSDLIDVGFTATMEQNLDKVADGESEWVQIIRDFYQPFADQVKKAQSEMPEVKTELEKVGRACPDCGHDLVIRWGRFGKFISCSNFPTCRHTEPFLQKIGVACPKDGGELVERKTRKNRVFYGCSNYPTCDFTSWKRPLPNPCPHCGGLLVVSNKREAQCTVCEQTVLLDQLQEEEKTRTA
jgi:DNA topoisomerase I